MLLILAVIFVLAQPEAPLAGPAVKPRPHTGLVQYDMSGRVIRPTRPIEQAAAEKLALTPEVRERVERVLADRAAAIDGFVVENLLLLNELQTVQAAGTLRDKVVLGIAAVRQVSKAIAGKSLREDIIRALPAEPAQEFRASLREYWRALHEEGKALKPRDPPPPWAVYIGESLASLGREIASSFERQSASGTLFVDYLTADLGLTEYQRGVIYQLKLDLLERTNMKPTEEDQKKLILGAAAYLNKDQRAKAIAKVAGKKPATR